MTAGLRDGGLISSLAWTGLLGIVLFVVTIVSLHFLQPELKPLDEAISYYVHGSQGWLLTVGVIGLGVASLAITCALANTVDGPGARSGRWLLGVWSVGVLLGGFFPADPPGHWNEPPSLAGIVHGNAALLAFSAFPVAALFLGRSFCRNRRWLPTATILLLLAVAAAISLIGFMASLMPVFIRPGPPVLLGLSERVLIVIYLAWLTLVAVTILKQFSSLSR
jgi:Protein of unknown function (DUF998)